jgi:hypothetical protein
MAIKPGDWVTMKTGMFAGRVGMLELSAISAEPYVRGLDFGTPATFDDLEPAEDPKWAEKFPWVSNDGSTNTDGFLAAYQKDDNTFWRVDTGHLQNVIDELIDRLENAEQRERERITKAVEAHLAQLDEDGWSATLKGEGFADMTGFGPGIIAAINGGSHE